MRPELDQAAGYAQENQARSIRPFRQTTWQIRTTVGGQTRESDLPEIDAGILLVELFLVNEELVVVRGANGFVSRQALRQLAAQDEK